MSLPFRHVLCPVDFSAGARGALRYAAAVAARMDAGLTVLFVDDPLLTTAAAAAAYDTAWLKKRTLTELRRFVASAGISRRRLSLEVSSGHAAAVIARTAERTSADVIVIGSHGLTGPAKWFFGSTAEQTLRTARVPVLVVPPQGARSRRVPAKWPGARIVLPVDLADYRRADVAAALRVTDAFNARPLLVHVVRPAALPAWLNIGRHTDERRRLDTARQQLQQLSKSVGTDAECQFAVGDPVEEIAASATGARAGLIVITLKKGRTLAGPRRGSISYGLVCQGRIPVLALPGER